MQYNLIMTGVWALQRIYKRAGPHRDPWLATIRAVHFFLVQKISPIRLHLLSLARTAGLFWAYIV